MSHEHWTAVDRYLTQTLILPDPILDAVLQASADAGLPAINVSPTQGKLLHLLARLQGARTILELGTLGGYSTIWLTHALPVGGHIITLESDPGHAKIARANFARAGLADFIDLRLGPALETLPLLAAEGRGPFDLIFIDADKANTPDYFTWALKLTRRGSLIIVDNVIRGGAVIDPASNDPAVQGIRRFNDLLAAEPRVTATALPTVGANGHDGFALILVTAEPPDHR